MQKNILKRSKFQLTMRFMWLGKEIIQWNMEMPLSTILWFVGPLSHTFFVWNTIFRLLRTYEARVAIDKTTVCRERIYLNNKALETKTEEANYFMSAFVQKSRQASPLQTEFLNIFVILSFTKIKFPDTFKSGISEEIFTCGYYIEHW